MSRLFRDRLVVPASLPKGQSPLPIFRWQQPTPHQPASPVGLIQEELAGYTFMGDISILPYRLQEHYKRKLESTELDSLVLENSTLRVVILPSLGGRVYSIEDKRNERELLFCNPVIQTGNLALRNAWFSGGIEWNGGGIPGHSASTCTPVFCHQVITKIGPILRVHDFDRVTETAWQIDLFLPENETKLYVHGRICNPNEKERQVYWWTNTAVAHQLGQRIVSPADYAIEHAPPDNQLERFEFPDQWGFDGSFPDHWQSSTSVFFRRSGQSHPWLAVCNPDGTGLGQISTRQLVGRKFFYFGHGAGGQHWMEFLSDQETGGRYIEVQAGITPTQNNVYTLGGGEVISWTECYAPIEACAAVATVDYNTAVQIAENLVTETMSVDSLDNVHAQLETYSSYAPESTLAQGPPWGMYHEKLIERRIMSGMSFETTDRAGPAWKAVAGGKQPSQDIKKLEADFVVSDIWLNAIDKLTAQYGEDWFSFLHRGIIALDREELDAAEDYLHRSLDLCPSSLASRCLAVQFVRRGDVDAAIKHYEKALSMNDSVSETELEFALLLCEAGQMDDLETFFNNMSPAARSLERTRILEAKLALQLREFEKLEKLLNHDFATIREGETTLSDLWQGLVIGQAERSAGRKLNTKEEEIALEQRPIPSRLDFVMLQEERRKKVIHSDG